jgi:hypothetical protein
MQKLNATVVGESFWPSSFIVFVAANFRGRSDDDHTDPQTIQADFAQANQPVASQRL